MTDKEREQSYEQYRQWQMNKVRYRNESIAYVLIFGIGLFFVLKNWHGIFVSIGIALIVGAAYLFYGIILKWYKKNKALSDLKKMAEALGARNVEIDSEKGTISFVVSSGEVDNRFEEFGKTLSDKGLKMKISRAVVPSGDNNMTKLRKNKTNQSYTSTGYINKNNQKNNGKTRLQGTDNNQFFYEMECLNCGHKYYANGSDIWQRKCPKCQGGKP